MKTQTGNEEMTMVQPRPFEDRVNGEFSTPGKVADALIDAEDRLPDPTVTLGASFALKATAEALARALRDQPGARYALYSPAMAAEFLRDASGALEALSTALMNAIEAVQLTRCGGDIPDGARGAPDEAENILDIAAHSARHAAQRTVVAARVLDQVEYAGYADRGRGAQLAAVAAELAQHMAKVDIVHEAGPNGIMASVEFTYRDGRYVLVDDVENLAGWELAELDGDSLTWIQMPKAHTSAVHPCAIVTAAFAAIATRLSATADEES